MRRELVTVEAEGADPDLGDEIDDGEGVKDGAAVAAAERSVGESGCGGGGAERGVYGGDRDDAVSGVGFGPRYHVPRHADRVLSL